MPINKMGESQVIEAFTVAFEDEYRKKFGDINRLAMGNFSGSQDRKYADFFAGTDSSCVLIEFKEYESEIAQEAGKPLRKKLCEELTLQNVAQARATHFIAYKSKSAEVEVSLVPYVDRVCPLFGIGSPPLDVPKSRKHFEFIDRFLDGRIGSAPDKFANYAGRLSTIAGGMADGYTAPFRAILYSRSTAGRVVATRFENLGELKKLLDKKPGPSPRP